jgi:hypothetical protein
MNIGEETAIAARIPTEPPQPKDRASVASVVAWMCKGVGGPIPESEVLQLAHRKNSAGAHRGRSGRELLHVLVESNSGCGGAEGVCVRGEAVTMVKVVRPFQHLRVEKIENQNRFLIPSGQGE